MDIQGDHEGDISTESMSTQSGVNPAIGMSQRSFASFQQRDYFKLQVLKSRIAALGSESRSLRLSKKKSPEHGKSIAKLASTRSRNDQLKRLRSGDAFEVVHVLSLNEDSTVPEQTTTLQPTFPTGGSSSIAPLQPFDRIHTIIPKGIADATRQVCH